MKRAVDKRGVPTSSRRPERPKTYITPSKSQPPIDRSWSISSSIVALPVTSSGTILPTNSKSEPNVHRLYTQTSVTHSVRDKKKKKIETPSNITLRKGQTQSSSTKASSGVPTGALRGASSISSLDSKHKIAPINPLKTGKGGSKDKLDKLGKRDERRNDRGLTSNNNKPPAIEYDQHLSVSAQTQSASISSTQDNFATVAALQQLEAVNKELETMAREKQQLALELQANQGELHALRGEVARLKKFHPPSPPLALTHSPLSDNEKQQLLLSHRASSAPASMHATPDDPPLNASPGGLLGGLGAATPEWDGSLASVEEVACLQDRIMQMQETHYSTNEELQATLQELADLQTQLTELQLENERLAEEKNVLLESLMRQTDRLEDSRTEVDTLKQLLYQDKDQPPESSTEREQKLVELLKNAQEEREVLHLKHESLSLELQEARGAHQNSIAESERLADRIKHLESALDAAAAEKRELDKELAQVKENNNARSIEISRLNTLLENARAKIEELEQDRALSDKSELDELLDNARKEKDALESQVASLQEQLSLCQCEIARLKDQILTLQEECKVTRNNAKCTQSELEYKCDQLKQENTNLTTELQALEEACRDLQVQAQCHLEDKRQLKALLSETQRHLGDAEGKLAEVEQELETEKNVRKEENAEWEQFQNDLLMTVRVANDFKTEAQQELQNLVLENKVQKDKVRQLEKELDKLKSQQAKSPSPPLRQTSVDSSQSVLSSVQQEIAVRRQKTALSRQDSRLSVKSLIESIENATKQTKAGPGSRSSSTSSLNSLSSETRMGNTPSGIIGTPTSPMRGDWLDVIPTSKGPLRERESNRNGGKNSTKNIINDGFTKLDVGKTGQIGKADDMPSIFQTAKGLDFTRRNSYSDLSERKDPLNALVKNGGSKRNALLKWCQNKTIGYRNIDITNFSSSWTDGLALCALLHTYLPDRVPYDSLTPADKRRNFGIAFAAAECVGIPTTLNINDMVHLERPDWQQVMAYVTAIYKHFET